MVLAGLRVDQVVAAPLDLIEITFLAQREMREIRMELVRLADRVVALEQQTRSEEITDLFDLAREDAKLMEKIETRMA